MSTANIAPLPERDIDANIRTNVRMLMARKRLKGTAVAPVLGLNRTTFSARLTGTAKWSAADAVQLAEFFGVSVETLSMDPDQLLRTGRFATPDLVAIAGGAGGGGSKERRRGHLRVVEEADHAR